MTGIWKIILGLTVTSALRAAPSSDPYVKNLTLVGVIHVEGIKVKGQSVAVVRDRILGKTRMLHQGDSLVDAGLEVRELGPQHIILGRGTRTFMLRVESPAETAATLSTRVEATDVELISETSTAETPTELKRLVPETDCKGEECPHVPDSQANKD